VAIFPKRLGIFQLNFTRLLHVPIYARLQIFTQLSATLTKLCYIKRDHPVHIMCAKCPPSAKTHDGIFTAARPAYAGTEGCSILLVFFYFFFYLTNLRKNGQSLFGAKYAERRA